MLFLPANLWAARVNRKGFLKMKIPYLLLSLFFSFLLNGMGNCNVNLALCFEELDFMFQDYTKTTEQSVSSTRVKGPYEEGHAEERLQDDDYTETTEQSVLSTHVGGPYEEGHAEERLQDDVNLSRLHSPLWNCRKAVFYVAILAVLFACIFNRVYHEKLQIEQAAEAEEEEEEELEEEELEAELEAEARLFQLKLFQAEKKLTAFEEQYENYYNYYQENFFKQDYLLIENKIFEIKDHKDKLRIKLNKLKKEAEFQCDFRRLNLTLSDFMVDLSDFMVDLSDFMVDFSKFMVDFDKFMDF